MIRLEFLHEIRIDNWKRGHSVHGLNHWLRCIPMDGTTTASTLLLQPIGSCRYMISDYISTLSVGGIFITLTVVNVITLSVGLLLHYRSIR